MILAVPQDGQCTVQLLREKELYHLVGKGHPGEGDDTVRPFPDPFVKAVRAADHEDNLPG